MNPFEELRIMKNRDGDEVRFVKVIKDDLIQVWQRDGDRDSYMGKGIKLLNHDIDIEELKTAGVFDLLNSKIQEEMGMSKVRVKEVMQEKIADMRVKRSHKYTNLPKELFCSCGKKIIPVYNILQKKADKLMIPLVDMIKGLKCRSCDPVKRGRISKDGVITKIIMICKCGATVSYPSNILSKTAEKKGISIDEMIKGYLCKTCNPVKLGRKPSGKVKQASTLKCITCGKEVTANWTYLNAKAKKMNISADELVKKFICQICKPSKGRPKKV